MLWWTLRQLKLRDPEIPKHAAEKLGKSRDPRVVEPLGAALKDESWQVREPAAWAPERIGDKRGLEPLVLILADKNPLVRERVTGARSLTVALPPPGGSTRFFTPFNHSLQAETLRFKV